MVAGRLFQVGYVDWRSECSSSIKETNVGLWLRCHTNCASKPAECTSYKTENNKPNETWAETWRRVWGGDQAGLYACCQRRHAYHRSTSLCLPLSSISFVRNSLS